MKKNIFVTGVILFLSCSFHGNSVGINSGRPDFDDSGIFFQTKPDKTQNSVRMDEGVLADRRNDEETLSVSIGEEGPAIRELVRDCYPDGNLVIGSACHEHYLGTQTEEILDREFSYVTPANDYKQSYVHPEPGVWRWERSDRWVNHCRENDQVIRMHAPISPQCYPGNGCWNIWRLDIPMCIIPTSNRGRR